jgi:diadenosine tetraphosphate (Ap4A) HIT family hydrolase
MSSFTMHPQLEADTHRVGDLDFTRVLLMDDARFPWLILVPRAPDLRELTDLSLDDQHRLLDEINRVAHVLHAMAKPDKLNIAMLGNVVPQLHVHVIARFTADEAWPKPVWGIGARMAYDADALSERIDALRAALHLIA